MYYSHQQLNQFATEQWNKTLPFLQGRYSLSRNDCEDIFQDSFIVLYKNIIDGKLDQMTSSLSTYFNSICRNKAMERIRGMGKEINMVDEFPNINKDSFEDDRIEKLLSLDNDTEQIEARKTAVVQQIVKDLPHPCHELLWGYYRDGLSLKTLAQMYNYKSENSLKVTKHRCCEKFKNHFQSVVQQLFE